MPFNQSFPIKPYPLQAGGNVTQADVEAILRGFGSPAQENPSEYAAYLFRTFLENPNSLPEVRSAAAAAVAGLKAQSWANGVIGAEYDAATMMPVPSVVPAPRHSRFLRMGVGLWLCYGPNTFSGVEISDGTIPAASVAPTALDVEQWIVTAKSCGCSWVRLIAKHVDGWCAWPTKQQAGAFAAYSSAQSPGAIDYIRLAADACAKHGIGLSLQYAVWDSKQPGGTGADATLDAAYNAYVRRQIVELLTNYGPIISLWIDGTWIKAAPRWETAALYRTAKEIQPECLVIFNHTIGNPAVEAVGTNPLDQIAGDAIKFFPSDARALDAKYPNPAGDPKTFTSGGATYWLPFESSYSLRSAGKWFWGTGAQNEADATVSFMRGDLQYALGQGNSLILSVPVAPTGKVSPEYSNALRYTMQLLGISTSAVDVLEGCSATASSSYDGSFPASKAVDGTISTMWAASESDASSWIEIDYGCEREVSALYIKQSFQRITRIVASVYSVDTASWIQVADVSGTVDWLDGASVTLTKTRGSKLRLVLTCAGGAAINVIRGYQ